jgi:hypothetical protein
MWLRLVLHKNGSAKFCTLSLVWSTFTRVPQVATASVSLAVWQQDRHELRSRCRYRCRRKRIHLSISHQTCTFSP